jgi:hypothetical protein
MSASDKPLYSQPAITNDLSAAPNPQGTEASAISGKKRFVVLSNDINLYFHTDAAEQISTQLEHDEGDRVRLAKKMFTAIQNGEIDAYDHRNGEIMPLPIGLQPICVRVNNVNDWLKREGYATKWTPGKNLITSLGATTKQSTEDRQVERWRMCEDLGLVMPTDTYGPYPRGISKVAKKIGIQRQSLVEDLDKYRNRRFS